jgi:hypothetical protein
MASYAQTNVQCYFSGVTMMVFDGELELGEGDGTGARISKQSIPPKSKKKKHYKDRDTEE